MSKPFSTNSTGEDSFGCRLYYVTTSSADPGVAYAQCIYTTSTSAECSR